MVLAERTLARSRQAVWDYKRKAFWREREDALRAGFRHSSSRRKSTASSSADPVTCRSSRKPDGTFVISGRGRMASDDPLVVELRKRAAGVPTVYPYRTGSTAAASIAPPSIERRNGVG
jgi:hypothetical protein